MNEWQPIETAPDDGCDILLGGAYINGHWDVQIGFWAAHRKPDGWPIVGENGPTHWMPLPPPPHA